MSDYYLQGRSKRCSRHLYDIYKLTPLIKFDDGFAVLIGEVREHRSFVGSCSSLRRLIYRKSTGFYIIFISEKIPKSIDVTIDITIKNMI